MPQPSSRLRRFADLSEPGRRIMSDAAAEFRARSDELCWLINREVLAAVPELSSSQTAFREQLELSTRAHMDIIPSMVGTWSDPSAAVVPPEALALAVGLGRDGQPVEVLLHAYRVGHAVIAQIWSDMFVATISDAPLLAEVSSAASNYMFAYIEALLQPLIGAYVAERDISTRERQSAREAEVRRVLAGEEQVDLDRAAVRLRYRLDRWHVGFVAWLVDEADATRLDRVAVALAGGAESDPAVLTVYASRTMVHGWVGLRSRPPASTVDIIDGVHIAVGEAVFGLDGFRRTHEQALLARRVTRLGTRGGVAHYRDVAVAALLSSDLDQARMFVESVFGTTRFDAVTRGLLETVAVYHAAGLSLRRTAELLGIHPNTVSYRVRRILELSGEQDRGSLRLRAAVALAPLVD